MVHQAEKLEVGVDNEVFWLNILVVDAWLLLFII